jgi:lipopolysaccharide biosynthesis glycosyltransferase
MTVVFCADANVVGALKTAIFSISEHLADGDSVDVYVVHENISLGNRQDIEYVVRSQCRGITVRWVEIPMLHASEFRPVGHLSRATYFRLLLGDVLPANLIRIIYLDCDLLLRHNIRPLWNQPMGNYTVLAARDELVPSVGSAHGIPETCREYDVAPEDPYFNAGIMIISLERWRSRRVGARSIEYLARHRSTVRLADQDVLNAVLGNDWGELDSRWNVQCGTPLSIFSPRRMGFFERVRRIRSAYLLHFTGPMKPWLDGPLDPERAEYHRTHGRLTSSNVRLTAKICGAAPIIFATAVWVARARARETLGAVSRRIHHARVSRTQGFVG